jgi:hypothetical protein
MDANRVQSNTSAMPIKQIKCNQLSVLNYDTTCATIVLTVTVTFILKTKTTFNEQLSCCKYRIRHKKKVDVTQVNATKQFLPTTYKPHSYSKTPLSFTYHCRMKRRFKKWSTTHYQSQMKTMAFKTSVPRTTRPSPLCQLRPFTPQTLP